MKIMSHLKYIVYMVQYVYTNNNKVPSGWIVLQPLKFMVYDDQPLVKVLRLCLLFPWFFVCLGE